VRHKPGGGTPKVRAIEDRGSQLYRL
jgi:hypothetical protein